MMRPQDPAMTTPPAPIPLCILMQDPVALTGRSTPQADILATPGTSILDAALAHGIQIEHACGGACACSTCHIYILEGAPSLSDPSDAELDRVEEAPGLRRNSRLACQCVLVGPGPVVVEVPAWNRNAVKEAPPPTLPV